MVGFDDVEQAAWLAPPLTTVRQPFTEIGATSARLALTLADGRSPAQERLRTRHHSRGAGQHRAAVAMTPGGPTPPAPRGPRPPPPRSTRRAERARARPAGHPGHVRSAPAPRPAARRARPGWWPRRQAD
ncbi:substrate-binding domain-containing protein [Micromonospora sp. BRA006-A]|nr:substrate-binding domain-containing protein [Micromonospora sp. BRA006-A]